MSVINSLKSRLRPALRTVFGEFNWQAPFWLWATAAVIRTRTLELVALVRAEPRRAVMSATLATGVIAVLIYGWQWYAHRPQPALVAFNVFPPPLTCYGCDPPGSPQPLVVQFAGSAAPLERVGHTIDAAKSGISIEPDVRGTWRWDDDRVLRFQPVDDWPIDAIYRVKLARKGFVSGNVLLEKYGFEFKSAAFAVSMAGTEFNQDPVIATDKKVVTSVTFTHPVDPESFEKHVRLRLFDKVTDKLEKELREPAFTVIYDKLKLNAYIHSAQLEVPPKAGRLTVAVEPGVHAARGGNESDQELTASVEVPGLNSLRIGGVSLDIVRDERNEPDQVMLIDTSYSVRERDMPAKVTAWLLPLEHPDAKLQKDFGRFGRFGPFRWHTSNFRPEVLTDSNRLSLTQIQGEREHYELHSFRYAADPGRFLYVRIQSGLRSFGGYVLGDTVERIVQVPEFPSELSILSQGSLLALSGEKTLSLFARNVPAMRIEVGRVLPRQLQHLVTQTSGRFERPQFRNWAFDAANITDTVVRIAPLPKVAPGKPQYEALNLTDYLGPEADRRGIFLLRVQAWNDAVGQPLDGTGPGWNDTWRSDLADARLIVVTDLGLLHKRSVDRTHDVFVQSIATGLPVEGATVEVIGRNGLAVLSETTDADGHVRFAGLEDFKREREPVLILARRGNDSSFLPLDERGRSLDLSRFEIGGVETSSDHSALSAYLFSDRGIYRPGEEILAAALVRAQDWGRSTAEVPLRVEITDPRGTVIRRELFRPGAAGFGEIRQRTSASSPTGTYTLAVSIAGGPHGGKLIGSTTVQVREFQPDRLRMQASFSMQTSTGWIPPDGLEGRIQLENLFGTPAQGRRVKAQLTLSPIFPSFRNFADYQFYDPQYAREGFSEQLAEVTTDAKGLAVLPLNLQRFAKATYRVSLVTEGFEADGGRGVTAEAAQLVSSMPYLVGYKPDGDLGYIARATSRRVNLVAIDPRAQSTAVDGLVLARLEIRYVSTLMRQPNGTFKYESRRKETELEAKPLAIAAKGSEFKLATDAPGTFAYQVRDASGLELSRIDYQVAGDANVTRKLEKNAELELKLSKPDYAPGEDVELSIRAPYEGAGLITIERERVYAWRWFKTSTSSSVQKIRMPEGLEGNAYVAVSFVRDPGSAEIYTSPLSYAVQPFSIDVDVRRNPVTITAPTKVKPGDTVKFQYRTEHPARLLLFAVDEGILQVAGYETPDPLSHFFQKRLLQVSTSQILDLILPEYRHLGLGSAPGGDAEGLLGKHMNPFRRKGEAPVAYWSGIVDADSTPRDLEYTVPDYFNGTLRVIAVAISDDRVGVLEQRTLVRGDFVLSPNVPTTVTPGDEFEVSVGVANNLEDSGAAASIAIELQTDPGLQVVDDARREVTIAENGETAVRFRLRANDVLGAANLRFTARGSGNKIHGWASRRVDLSVRPATPYMTLLNAGIVTKGDRELKVTRNLYPHYRRLQTGISAVPLQFAHGFASYLANYPYSCTEQLVSQAMPAVVLADRPEFGSIERNHGGTLDALIAELRTRQNDTGAYKLWPGGDEVVEFVAIYTQHFLLEASERGERVPGDLLANGNNYLVTLAARDGNNLAQERQSAYAIYLLTRQGQRMTAQIAASRKRLEERYRDVWEQDLAAAWLAASLDLMKQDRDAESLIESMKFGAGTADDIYYDPMTRDALLLYVMSRHFPELLGRRSNDALTRLAERVNEGVYHSLSAGTTLLALDAYTTATERTAATFSIAEILRDKRVRALALPQQTFPEVAFSEQAESLRFRNTSSLNAYYMVEQTGFDRTPPQQAIKQGLEILREYTDDEGNVLTRIELGQQVVVHLKFRSLTQEIVPSIAFVDLLPGGFELVMPQTPAGTEFAEASPGSEDSGYPYRGTDPGWSCRFCTGRNASLEYADAREDRVVFYAGANRNLGEIMYRIKATNVGSYVVPPAYGEAMYDRATIGRSTAGRVEVVRP